MGVDAIGSSSQSCIHVPIHGIFIQIPKLEEMS
jgi:hypothetical protein